MFHWSRLCSAGAQEYGSKPQGGCRAELAAALTSKESTAFDDAAQLAVWVAEARCRGERLFAGPPALVEGNPPLGAVMTCDM